MAETTLHRTPTPTTQNFRQRMLGHEVNGVRELSCGSADAAIELTRNIHALATYMGAAVREENPGNRLAGERPLDTLNNEITAGAFDAIGYLAAAANFHACESACDFKD